MSGSPFHSNITTQNICILCRNGGESIKTRKKLVRLSFAILSNSRLIFYIM